MLAESENLELIAEHCPVASLAIEAGLICYANAAAAELFGASGANSLVGQPVRDRLFAEDATWILERLEPVSNAGQRLPPRTTFCLRLDGARVDVELSATVLRRQDGDGPAREVALVYARQIDLDRDVQPRGKDDSPVPVDGRLGEHPVPDGTRHVDGFMDDLAASVRSQAELQQHQDHLEALVAERTAQLSKMTENLLVLVRQAPISIAMFNRQMVYLAASDRWIEEYGRGHRVLLGLSHYDLHPDIPEGWKAVHRRALAGETLRNDEDSWEMADGSRRWLRWAVLPWHDAAGEIGGIIMSAEDITADKLLREDLRQAHREALRLAQAKSYFLANMSHEIRTPLHAIVGLTHLLQDGPHTPEQGEKLGHIAAAADHLMSIISDVLDLSKIESGKLELENIELRLRQVLGTVEQLVRADADAKGLSLTLDCPDRLLDQQLWGDPQRLVQILVNLGSNAVKFTERGSVTLRATAAHEDEETIDVRFEVVDTGIGIEPDTVPRLFSNFEQADNTTSRRYGGTGLGLAISNRLLGLMGSRIEVNSRPGLGSNFLFVLRLAKRSGVALSAPAEAPTAATGQVLSIRYLGARVLVVEDDSVSRLIAFEMLTARGLNVDVARDGFEAVAMVGRTRYQLILMDVQMPNMDGIEATRQIRALPNGIGVPIVATTANAFFEDRQRCLDAGMNGFITKPVTAQALFDVLLRHVVARPDLSS